MVIREFTPEDALQVLEVHRAAITELNSGDYTPEQIKVMARKTTPKECAKQLARGYSRVAVEGNRVVGFGSLTLDGRLDMLYVDPKFVGKGIGSDLLAVLEVEALGAGMKELTVDSTRTAFNFYLKNGFTLWGEDQKNFDGIRIPVYILKKKL